MFELTGQTAIVTGGATGIGEAIARRLSSAGATVAIADIDAQFAADAAKKIGNGAFAVALDITNPDSVTAALSQVLDRAQSIEIVVNNAASPARPHPSGSRRTKIGKK